MKQLFLDVALNSVYTPYFFFDHGTMQLKGDFESNFLV